MAGRVQDRQGHLSVRGREEEIDLSVGSAVPQWRAGKVKLLGVGAGKRLAQLAEVPTVAERGLPGIEAVSWFGLFVPAGTPRDVVAKLNAEVRRIFAEPEFQKTFLERQYFQSIAGTPEELADYLKSEEAKWSKVIIAGSRWPCDAGPLRGVAPSSIGNLRGAGSRGTDISRLAVKGER